ncbi:zingipain-1-like [Dioscorea cayenensis subsp. rotundata]|uniref:Zingipain-1-like n=1 Tax=Dioscorea cayennensis subsp. rotundata TaxID=55577 RepID=A0AB40BWC3_DIOCR|nr:zingipain-1-like [Dioscorea cayenensis subsp. rotundata]
MTSLLLLFLSILSLFSFSSSSIPTRSEYEVDLLFEGWLVKHNKSYNKDSFEKSEEKHLIYLAVNSTLFPEWNEEGNENDTYYSFNDAINAVPESIDWRELGAVTPVKYQAGCASCWAFAAVATVEGLNQILTGNLISLSEQQLIDCMYKSCQPGWPIKALLYIKKNGGIDTDMDYKYTATVNQCDKSKENTKVVSIDGYQVVQSNNEYALMKAVAEQPIAAFVSGYEPGIPKISEEFDIYYHKDFLNKMQNDVYLQISLSLPGIFSGYCSTKTDHVVTIVGYGTEGDKDYWIIKNSWSDFWGVAGYMRMERNIKEREGKCGIATQLSRPTKIKQTGDLLGVKAPLGAPSKVS